ncbi:hypothetical protein Tco_0676059 [Tanacetum coccineum]
MVCFYDSVTHPMVEKSKLDEDLQGKPVDATLYHGMIGSLMYLVSIDPTYFAVHAYVPYRNATEKHLNNAHMQMQITRVARTLGCSTSKRSSDAQRYIYDIRWRADSGGSVSQLSGMVCLVVVGDLGETTGYLASGASNICGVLIPEEIANCDLSLLLTAFRRSIIATRPCERRSYVDPGDAGMERAGVTLSLSGNTHVC